MIKIAIRVDAGPEIGFGHLMRSLTLSNELNNLGCQIFFLVKNSFTYELVQENNWGRAFLLENSSLNKEPDLLSQIFKEHEIDGVIIDSYQVTEEYFKKCEQLLPLVGYIDDLNRVPFHGAFLLNGNLYALDLNYSNDAKIRYFLGNKYTLLRKEFRNLPQCYLKKGVKRILVTLGGSDVANLTPRLIKILKKFTTSTLIFDIIVGKGFRNFGQIRDMIGEDCRFKCHFDVRTMSSFMLQSDLAITTAGSTVNELVATGTPVISFVVAENQELLAEKVEGLGIGKNLGWYNRVTDQQILQTVKEVLFDDLLRQKMGETGRKLLDGKGAKRVATEIVNIIKESDRRKSQMAKLAIHGGKPIRENFLPYAQQWIADEDIQVVTEALQSSWLTTGPAVKEFENKIAEYVGAKYVVAFANGTAALHGAVFAAGVGSGDEVITTPITFAASANCALYQGGKPVFADIDPITLNIDPKKIREKITSKTKVIIPVDYTGEPVNLEEIHQIAKEHDLVVIEDAAHALGATYQGKNVGGLSDMTMFSFHPVKHITTGEGGIITTNNPEYYEKLLVFRNHGITRNPDLLKKNEGPWYYEMLALGYNYRITDIQSILGVSQLGKLEMFLEKRRQYAATYNKELSQIEGIITPYSRNLKEAAWHLYVIQLELDKFRADRREIYEALLKENIGVNVHYIPVYLHPYYQELGYQAGECPVAERVYERMLTIPLFPKMDKEDLMDVVKAFEKVLSFYRIEK